MKIRLEDNTKPLGKAFVTVDVIGTDSRHAVQLPLSWKDPGCKPLELCRKIWDLPSSGRRKVGGTRFGGDVIGGFLPFLFLQIFCSIVTHNESYNSESVAVLQGVHFWETASTRRGWHWILNIERLNLRQIVGSQTESRRWKPGSPCVVQTQRNRKCLQIEIEKFNTTWLLCTQYFNSVLSI